MVSGINGNRASNGVSYKDQINTRYRRAPGGVTRHPHLTGSSNYSTICDACSGNLYNTTDILTDIFGVSSTSSSITTRGRTYGAYSGNSCNTTTCPPPYITGVLLGMLDIQDDRTCSDIHTVTDRYTLDTFIGTTNWIHNLSMLHIQEEDTSSDNSRPYSLTRKHGSRDDSPTTGYHPGSRIER